MINLHSRKTYRTSLRNSKLIKSCYNSESFQYPDNSLENGILNSLTLYFMAFVLSTLAHILQVTLILLIPSRHLSVVWVLSIPLSNHHLQSFQLSSSWNHILIVLDFLGLCNFWFYQLFTSPYCSHSLISLLHSLDSKVNHYKHSFTILTSCWFIFFPFKTFWGKISIVFQFYPSSNPYLAPGRWLWL